MQYDKTKTKTCWVTSQMFTLLTETLVVAKWLKHGTVGIEVPDSRQQRYFFPFRMCLSSPTQKLTKGLPSCPSEGTLSHWPVGPGSNWLLPALNNHHCSKLF